ncbi:hypothetical protein AK812_SmicGene9412 [Symbiodinium microadriaticum]|uniref:Uncharacterized protein n=1 Tax=Symbiodinium microadriaticum TaxID=2951 RepID=A0A1Q9EII3_SYMMI|nr:hypothetical protein AK812_SmicGene9412 [Symbiodinium microadriaticum]
MGGFEAESSDDENDETARSAVPKRALPCTTEDVLAKHVIVESVSVTTRCDHDTSDRQVPGTSPFEGARWRQPQEEEEEEEEEERRSCSMVLMVLVLVLVAVLIYGGLGDGGRSSCDVQIFLGEVTKFRLPLSDAFEDLSLEYVWSLLDAGGKEHCETADS